MKIESRVPDIVRNVRANEQTDRAVNRQRSDTSGLGGDSTRESIVSNVDTSREKAQRISPPVPVLIDVHKAMEMLNMLAEAQKKDVSFSVDEESEATVIKVFKTQTGELIKQFPSEEILAMKASIRKNTGWFFDSKA